MTSEAVEVVELFPPCSWEVEGEKITFPIDSINEQYRNRIVRHKRIYRNGARLDDTGGEETVWTVSVSFYNNNDEPGIDQPTLQYPDLVDRLCDACKVHETGTLFTPTRGARRCRAESYDRTDESMTRDHAAVSFVFVEDNEDDATQQDYHMSAGSLATRRLTNEGVEWAYEEGAGGGFDISDINEFASELEGLANAPGDFVGDLEAKADAIQRKVESIEDTYTTKTNEAATEVMLLLTNPGASLALRRLRKVADQAKRLAEKKAAGQLGGVTSVVFPKIVSIFDVAQKFNQEAGQLMPLNPTIEDMLRIPANTPINIFDTPRVRRAKSA